MNQSLSRWIALTMIAAGLVASVSVNWLIDDAVEDVLDKQVGLIKSGIIERFELFDGFLFADESRMQQRLEKALPEISDILLSDRSKLTDWTPTELKLLAEHYRVDEIYIIDPSTRVVNTSFEPDMGFELGTISTDLRTYLENIALQKNIVFHDRFTLSSKTGVLNKYAYYAPANSSYIIEASLEIKPFLSALHSPEYNEFLFEGLFENRLGNQLFSNEIDLFVVNELVSIPFDGRHPPMARSSLPDLKPGQVISIEEDHLKTYYFHMEMSGLMESKAFQYILIRSQFDMSAANALARSLIAGIFFVLALVWLIIYLLINLILRHTIVRRVQRVNQSLQAISEGDYGGDCKVEGEDEINSIAEHINALASTLATRERQLHDANETLEERVKERTLELENEIEKRCLAEHELSQLAITDALTGLPNRRLIDDYLKRTLLSSQRTHLLTAVMFLDLDNFKIINDSMGHGAGDKLLKTIGSRLTSAIRGSDVAGRWGGDEFIVLLPDLDGDRKIVKRHVENVVEKILRLVRADISIQDADIQCTVSIGITISNPDSTPETLFREADLAMYEAKGAGKNNFCFYEDIMQTVADERHKLEMALRQAVRQDELSVYFQPQVNAEQELIGAEALVRWRKTDAGYIEPDTIVPLAEETGLIHAIGDFVLETSCGQYRRWLDQGISLPRLSINLSIKQLERSDFVEQLSATVERHRLPVTQVYLEIADSTFWDSHARTHSTIKQLRELGFNVSLDDFGTGHSSLNNLKESPVDELKIDQSFINGIEHNEDDAATIGLMLSMAQHLGVNVVAEGVETDEQYQFLLERGCDNFQGYLFSPALAAEDFVDYVGKKHTMHQPSSISS